jgi:FkbM family methyltransferase
MKNKKVYICDVLERLYTSLCDNISMRMKELTVIKKIIKKVVRRNCEERPIEKQKIITGQVDKYILYMNESHQVQHYLEKVPTYNRNLQRLAKEVFNKDKHGNIIDIGANIGDSVAMIRSAGIDNHVFCIEGSKEYVKMLKMNKGILKEVTVYNKFLSDKNGYIKAENVITNGTGELKKSQNMKVRCSTFDSLMKKNNIRNIRFIKIDTDGYDLRILKGCRKLLKDNELVIFFEYAPFLFLNNGDDGLETFSFLRKLGYIYAIFYDNKGRLLCSLELSNGRLLEELDLYIREKKGAFSYFDIAIFHQKDEKLFKKFLRDEMIAMKDM